jgi:alanine racemase
MNLYSRIIAAQPLQAGDTVGYELMCGLNRRVPVQVV